MSEDLEWDYPLHFIDFETATAALPYHKGMSPYEAVAFQWSCHTISQPGVEPEHYEWINLDQKFPNFEFARSLKRSSKFKVWELLIQIDPFIVFGLHTRLRYGMT